MLSVVVGVGVGGEVVVGIRIRVVVRCIVVVVGRRVDNSVGIVFSGSCSVDRVQ